MILQNILQVLNRFRVTLPGDFLRDASTIKHSPTWRFWPTTLAAPCCCELHTSLYPLSVGRVVRREGSIHVAEEFVSCLLHQKGWFGHGKFLPVLAGVGWTSSSLVVQLYYGLEARGLEEEFREDVLPDSSDGWEVTYLQYHHHSSLSPHWIITFHHSNQDVVGVSAGGVRLKILL